MNQPQAVIAIVPGLVESEGEKLYAAAGKLADPRHVSEGV